MAGVLQIVPWSLSLRELWAMYDEHQVNAWDHTAFIVACQCSEKVHPFKLNPYRAKKKKESEWTSDDVRREHDKLAAQGKICKS